MSSVSPACLSFRASFPLPPVVEMRIGLLYLIREACMVGEGSSSARLPRSLLVRGGPERPKGQQTFLKNGRYADREWLWCSIYTRIG